MTMETLNIPMIDHSIPIDSTICIRQWNVPTAPSISQQKKDQKITMRITSAPPLSPSGTVPIHDAQGDDREGRPNVQHHLGVREIPGPAALKEESCRLLSGKHWHNYGPMGKRSHFFQQRSTDRQGQSVEFTSRKTSLIFLS